TVLVSNPYGQQSAFATLNVLSRPTIACGSDKTVDLGSAWDFDAPVATGSNVTVSIVSTVTNSACGDGYVATRQYVATDAAGLEPSCAHQVTAISTRPTGMTCPADKTVPHDTTWDFGVPAVQDAATVPEVVYGNWTSGLISALNTRMVE